MPDHLQINPSDFKYFNRARDGLGCVLDALKLKERGGTILLPAYIGWSSHEGSGIFDPIQSRGLPVRFYRMKTDLTIDLDSLRSNVLAASEGSVLLLVHYFGRPDPQIDSIVLMAKENSIPIIEDAAHAFFSAVCLASCGDKGIATIFSLHKMFDISSGGALRIFDSQISIQPALSGISPHVSWLDAVRGDHKEVARIRMENYQLLNSFVSRWTPLVKPLWSGLPKGTIPQSFPVLAKTTGLRDRLYFYLKKEGFFGASLYHTLIEPLRRADQYPEANFLSQRIFNLPVKQTLCKQDIIQLTGFIAALLDWGA